MFLVFLYFASAYFLFGLLSYDFQFLCYVGFGTALLQALLGDKDDKRILALGYFYTIIMLIFIVLGQGMYSNAGKFYVWAVGIFIVFAIAGALYSFRLQKELEHVEENQLKIQSYGNAVYQAPEQVVTPAVNLTSNEAVNYDTVANPTSSNDGNLMDYDYYQDFGDGSFLADCGTYYDASNAVTPVPDKYKVNKYLPKPAEEKYSNAKAVTLKKSEMLYFVSVNFSSSMNEYDYICDDKSVKVGDVVLVPAQGEEKQATVIQCH